MALLRISDKYAQERGGWKSDKVMKKVYMQAITEERQKVDDIVDDYFEKILEPEKKNITHDATPEELIERIKSSNPDGWYDALMKFMQHEMQHK